MKHTDKADPQNRTRLAMVGAILLFAHLLAGCTLVAMAPSITPGDIRSAICAVMKRSIIGKTDWPASTLRHPPVAMVGET